MDSTSTGGRATRSPAPSPYTGNRHRPPHRYQSCATIAELIAAIGRDLLTLHRRDKRLFYTVAHAVSDAVSTERRQQRYSERHLPLREELCPAPISAEAAVVARLRLRGLSRTVFGEDRLMLLLSAEGYTGTEIAQRLDREPWWVHKRLREIRETLRGIE